MRRLRLLRQLGLLGIMTVEVTAFFVTLSAAKGLRQSATRSSQKRDKVSPQSATRSPAKVQQGSPPKRDYAMAVGEILHFVQYDKNPQVSQGLDSLDSLDSFDGLADPGIPSGLRGLRGLKEKSKAET